MSLISSITGDITSTGIDWVDVNVGNFSLRVSVPASIADELSNTSESIQLFTSLRMRPENINLYGFLNEESRDLFEVLLNVNGVGPRHALGIMSSLTPEDLATAVEIGDAIVALVLKKIDGSTYTEIYNDIFLKKYTTSLFKKQWGQNLMKYDGVQLPGGVTLNGRQIYDDGNAELEKHEEELQLKYQLPDNFYLG